MISSVAFYSQCNKYISLVQKDRNCHPQRGSPQIHPQICSMGLRRWYPPEGENSLENIHSYVQYDGIHPWIEARPSSPLSRNVDDNKKKRLDQKSQTSQD